MPRKPKKPKEPKLPKPKKVKPPKVKQAEIRSAYFEDYVRRTTAKNPKLGTNEIKRRYKQEHPDVMAPGNDAQNAIINAVKGQEKDLTKSIRRKKGERSATPKKPREYDFMPTFAYEKDGYNKRKPINPLTDKNYAYLVRYSFINEDGKKDFDYVYVTSNTEMSDYAAEKKAKDNVIEASQRDLDNKYAKVRELKQHSFTVVKRYVNL